MLVKIHQNIPKFLLWTLAILCILSPRNSPWQLAIAKGFAKANSVIRVITWEKILLRWLFHRKIYIQFTNIIYKQEISLARASGVSACATRSQVNYIFSVVYSSSLFIHVAMEQVLLSDLISLYQWNSVTSHF